MLPQEMKFTPVTAKPILGATASHGTIGLQTIPVISGTLSLSDRLGGILVRWDIGRNDYRVEPGLYAYGKPDRTSAVLVTANYKLTFDAVRKELAGLSVWLLVLDTHGINVWCAAGKGSFGTEELVRRIKLTALERTVSHREIILPQLGAPGVAAHLVTKETGFIVRYGPVRAADISAYLANGKIKTESMKEVHFNLGDRLAVAPVEIAHAWPFLFAAFIVSALVALPFDAGSRHRFIFSALSLIGGIAAGTVLFPALLPILPFRAFAVKGAILGFLWTAGAALLSGLMSPALSFAPQELLPVLLLTVPTVSFLAMNFTGASTYTCQKGAELEVKIGLPLMLLSALAGVIIAALSVLGRFA